ncbi:hypothetical protein [Nocardioides sp. R-C-SC26]|nr:hypothetical protein [Nocardioides sp. R-C-SC26]
MLTLWLVIGLATWTALSLPVAVALGRGLGASGWEPGSRRSDYHLAV